MTYRNLLHGALMIALTFMTTTAQAQSFGESSDEDTSSSTGSETSETSESSTTSSSSSSGTMGTSSSTSSSSSSGTMGSDSSSTAPAPAASSSGGSTKSADGTNSLSEGNISLSFTVPGGGNPYASGTAGVWYLVTDSVNLGINLGLGLDNKTFNANTDNDDTRTAFDLLLAPAVRYYLMNDKAISPYILGQLNFHTFSDGNDDTVADPEDDDNAFNAEEQLELALIGGFGLEWFPVKYFSIGGHVGLGIDILRPDQAGGGGGGGQGGGGGGYTKTGVRVGTFTSALTANLYF